MLDVTLRFACDGSEWTEGYYLDPPAEDMETTVDRLIDARVDILADPARIIEATAWDVNDRRHPRRWPMFRPGNYTLVVTRLPIRNPPIHVEHTEECLLMACATPKGAHRMLFFGGIPSQGALSGQNRLRTPLQFLFVQRAEAFRDLLFGPALNLHLRELIDPPDAPSAVIDRIDTDARGLYRVHTATPFAGEARSQVRLIGSRGNNLSRMRGLRRIVGFDGDQTFSIDRGPAPERGPIRYTGGAQIIKVDYRFAKAEWLPLARSYEWRLNLLPWRWFKHTYPFALASRLRGGPASKRRGRERSRP